MPARKSPDRSPPKQAFGPKRRALGKAPLALFAAMLGLLSCSPPDPPSPQRVPSGEPPIVDPNWVTIPPLELRPAAERNPRPTELVYLDPDEFPEAPPELRSVLKELGCQIPQVYFMSMPESLEPNPPHNLVPGYFRNLDELHWAVLCSHSGFSAVLLFDSLGQLVDEIEEPTSDERLLRDIDGEGTLGFSLYIEAADREHILADHDSFGGPQPPPIWHDGLEVGYAETASSIHYWHHCRWIHLQGGD